MRTIIVTFLFLSFNLLADDTNSWAEVSVGGGSNVIGTTISFKHGSVDNNWAFEFGGYTEQFLSTIKDRDSGETIDHGSRTIGLTKNWNTIWRFGYMEAGAGLGFAQGMTIHNCSHSSSGWVISFEQICDTSQWHSIGIPAHASIVFGKYTGVGLKLSSFLTRKGSNIAVMFTIPFGDFTN